MAASQLALALTPPPGPQGQTCGGCTHFVATGSRGVCWPEKPPREWREYGSDACAQWEKHKQRYTCDTCGCVDFNEDGGVPDGWRGEVGGDEHVCVECQVARHG